MGGGDLNLKKSWHPQTMKNIERVWKAEQKYEAERKKIEELQKELKDERNREEMTRYAEETGAIKKRDDRLDWMYQGPAGQVSRDEYLLGRPIDKQITEQYEEPESGPSAETGLLPGSIFNPSTPASALDLTAKIREDPLFEIRKCEEASKREVLTNPVKMKKIKDLLRQNLKKDKKKKRKKEKKEKKDKDRGRRHRRSSGSEEEKNHRYVRMCPPHHWTRLSVLLSLRSASRHDPPVDAGSHSRPPGYGLQLPASRDHRPPVACSSSGRRGRSRSTSPPSQPSSGRAEWRQRAERPPRQRSPVSRKLSAAQLERRRQEMMEEARQRGEDRENNVRRYQRQDEQEQRREQAAPRHRHTGFIHMKLESAASSSLEDRVKRNIHSIQRTPASLDNFLRR
ncbi:pre-mRNA-splicing factor CWC25 homolog isoform X2 [Antennarius striatus]|uniref:pre-mRNA-splicing factor CWC25 homolog isoform X2 n=1 Tax=Antennarius striatus TaxID=241820 RepID=UPI0035B0FC77